MRVAGLIAALALLAGCPPRPGGATRPPPGLMPTYRQAVERYNANAGRIATLWARAVAELNFTQDGRRRFEQGDGILALALPDRSAFSMGKLGNPLFWAGTDATRYWLLDLREERVAYVGQRVDAAAAAAATAPQTTSAPAASARLPVPIYPPDLLRVLGIGALPEPAAGDVGPGVSWSGTGYVIEPPGSAMRLLLDPQTFLPQRIELLDRQGVTRLAAELAAFEPVALAGKPPGGLPRIATRIRLTLPDRDASMTLFLSSPSDGKEKISDDAFDLDKVMGSFRPRRVERVGE